MPSPLSHARHNFEACQYLHAGANFPDWEVTTAFYCAMHYIHAATFPFTELDTSYNNIEAYFDKHHKPGDTKHSMTLTIVQKKHSSISPKYKLLKDIAHTARYHDYEIPKPVVNKARQNMNHIKDYCESICDRKTAEESKKPDPGGPTGLVEPTA